MSRDLELAMLKKLSKEKQQEEVEKANVGTTQPKGLDQILA